MIQRQTIGTLRRLALCFGLLLAPTLLSAQNPAETPADEPVKSTGKMFQLDFKNRPSLRIADIVQIDVKTKWHFDFRQFSPNIEDPSGVNTAFPLVPDTFYLRRARVGIKGKVSKYIEYEVEREFREDIDSTYNEWHPWKDVYGDVRLHKYLKVQVGKFKLPFGLEETGSEDRLDYAFKSQTTDTLTPARERGIMIHSGFLKGDRMTYQFGVFRYDGENSDVHGIPTAGRTYVGRLSGEALRNLKMLPKTIRHTYLGIAMTHGKMFQGLNGVGGSTYSGFTFFDHMFVNGNRQRIGTEVAWTEGKVTLKGEYIRMSEERKQQGIRGEDLPSKISRGWYADASWALLGEMKSKTPKKPFLAGGFGAVEVGARFDVLTFFSAEGAGLPSRSPRAPVILPNTVRTWTVGPTWYLNRFLKIQVNAQRERVTDISRKALLGHDTFWTGIIRLQGAM